MDYFVIITSVLGALGFMAMPLDVPNHNSTSISNPPTAKVLPVFRAPSTVQPLPTTTKTPPFFSVSFSPWTTASPPPPYRSQPLDESGHDSWTKANIIDNIKSLVVTAIVAIGGLVVAAVPWMITKWLEAKQYLDKVGRKTTEIINLLNSIATISKFIHTPDKIWTSAAEAKKRLRGVWTMLTTRGTPSPPPAQHSDFTAALEDPEDDDDFIEWANAKEFPREQPPDDVSENDNTPDQWMDAEEILAPAEPVPAEHRDLPIEPPPPYSLEQPAELATHENSEAPAQPVAVDQPPVNLEAPGVREFNTANAQTVAWIHGMAVEQTSMPFTIPRPLRPSRQLRLPADFRDDMDLPEELLRPAEY